MKYLPTATLLFVTFGFTAQAADPGTKAPEAPREVGHPLFASPHAHPITVVGDRVFVVNTPSDTIDVIDAGTRKLLARVAVGIDPVSLAVRPDGKELWVSNHVSDSVSVIDIVPESRTHLQVLATIQKFNPDSRATEFDEPVSIAFADNSKAYVALSSENRIAVIDVASRRVTKTLHITAQDPRAIVVRNERLYVIPFESNNKTQLSGGRGDKIDGELVTFDAYEHAIRNNNVLSIGAVMDIVKNPAVPDRDLYVFDTRTDRLVEVVDTLGTLLYGLTVNSRGEVFVAQTDARNDANGRAGTKKHGLAELDNRAFLNRITRVRTGGGDDRVSFIDLEPLPPEQPGKGMALATPFAVEVSSDDSLLFATAAGSDKLFTVDPDSGEVLDRIPTGAAPRGIALQNNSNGAADTAWVFNALANTVSIVDVSDPKDLSIAGFVKLDDPTDHRVKQGRIWFNDADASTTGTFSCASCHPDGHTDQLLWVLKTPVVTGGNQIMPRSTMPIRGLRDTAPFHWDGIPGDPYGGINSASVRRRVEANSDPNDPASPARHLIDGGLASTMHLEGKELINDEGKSGLLTAAERDEMAEFLINVPYPPAQKRPYTNKVTDRARRGFELFHIKGDRQGDPRPNVCGNCHRMPFLVSTNTPGTGMDAPTWRGAYDRFLILPQGRLNIIEFDFYRRVAEQGIPERSVWQFSWAGRRRFDPIWDMVLEQSNGHSGAFARQVTLNKESADELQTADLLEALENAARDGGVVLEADGVLLNGEEAATLSVQFDPVFEGGSYVEREGDRTAYKRSDLLSLAKSGDLIATLTGRHNGQDVVKHPQPAIWTRGPIERQRGRQRFPILHPDDRTMRLSGRHIREGASIVVNGRGVSGTVDFGAGENVDITLDELPEPGLHLVQLLNAGGQYSNDFIFHVAEGPEAARELQITIDEEHIDSRSATNNAIRRGDLDQVKRALARGAGISLDVLNNKTSIERINAQAPDGSTPISTAAQYNQLEILKYLLAKGANANATNRDGNTPLIVASFWCNTEIVKVLLQKGADPNKENRAGHSAIEAVSSDLDDGLKSFYRGVAQGVGIELDLDRIEKTRPKIAELLKNAVRDE